MADWQTLARRTAKQVGVDPDIFVRLVGAESTGNPNAKSPAGAIGYTQLMPDTAHGLGVDPYNPRQNLVGGARYLKQQLGRFGNYSDALRAYNAGPNAVRASHGYPETNAYVQKILHGLNPPATHTGGGQGTRGVPAPAVAPSNGGLGGLGSAQGPAGDVSSLLGLLNQKRPAQGSMEIQAPAFSARPAMPGGYQAPISSSGGARDTGPDIGDLLKLVRTQAGTGTPGTVGGTDAPDATGGTSPAVGGSPAPRGGHGHVTIAPGADRPGTHINPAVVNFVDRVSGMYGQPLTIGTGTNHNRLTINGTVSDHWSGNGADVPLTGRALIRAGQDALIQAGMSPAKARKQTGGGYNVGSWQVIFNTNAPGWGDHTTHLHVGRRTR
jgi:hypothetical protein